MQIEGTKLIFIMNFSVLHFFKFGSRKPQIAQTLVFTLDFQNFLHGVYWQCALTGLCSVASWLATLRKELQALQVISILIMCH